MFLQVFTRRARTVGYLAALLLAGSSAACSTRDRFSFPGTGPGPVGDGPATVIDDPGQDTTVSAGPTQFVSGTSTDPDGIDTLYFETVGGITSFQPAIHAGTSFRFGLPLTTNGQSGQTITVRVFGTDALGHRGDTATRQVTVQ
jgi:hypothetical protein